MCSLIPTLEKDNEISSTKAIIELQRRSRELFLAVNEGIEILQKFLQNLVIAWSKISLKDRYRKKRIWAFLIKF